MNFLTIFIYPMGQTLMQKTNLEEHLFIMPSSKWMTIYWETFLQQIPLKWFHPCAHILLLFSYHLSHYLLVFILLYPVDWVNIQRVRIGYYRCQRNDSIASCSEKRSSYFVTLDVTKRCSNWFQGYCRCVLSFLLFQLLALPKFLKATLHLACQLNLDIHNMLLYPF